MAGVKGRSGGARPGAGRKPKPPQVGTISADTPLEFLEAAMRDNALDMALRVRAASYAAPYRHAKKGDTGKGQARKEAAEEVVKRSKFAPAAAPKLVVDNG